MFLEWQKELIAAEGKAAADKNKSAPPPRRK